MGGKDPGPIPHRSLISIFSSKIVEFFFADFYKMLQNLPEFAEFLLNFLLNLTNFSRDFPKMQQFWENPKIAHLIFVLEMRTFNFRFEKHLIFIFTNI